VLDAEKRRAVIALKANPDRAIALSNELTVAVRARAVPRLSAEFPDSQPGTEPA